MTTFRTSGPWGSGKGSNLSPAEVDANFYELQLAIEEIAEAAPAGVGISNITAGGSQMTIHLTNGTTKTVTLPVSRLNWRGPYQAGTTYAVNDIFRDAETGLYITKTQHISVGPFTPSPAVELMLPRAVADAAPILPQTVAFTLSPAMALNYIRVNATSEVVVTVPSDEAEAIAIGEEFHFRQVGAGALAFTPAAGVTINGVSGFANKTRGPGAVATLKKVAANQWDLFGVLLEA